MEPVSHAAVEEDGSSGLVIEVFDDLDEGSTYMVYSDPENWTHFVMSDLPGLLLSVVTKLGRLSCHSRYKYIIDG